MPPKQTAARPKGSSKMPAPKTAPLASQRFFIDPPVAFAIFAAANLLAALYAPIQDCDEVYNYWEPAHYLAHGYGRQTWEYSPEYALRSYVYVGLHAALGSLARPFGKPAEFYLVRVCLAAATAFCESRLYAAVARAFNPRVGVMLIVVLLASPGMFHAAAAFLPSAFAMACNMLGTAAFLDWPTGSKSHVGITWFGLGGVIGWPFAALLVAPFVTEEVFLSSITKDYVELVRRLVDGTVRVSIAVTLQIAVDAFFYHKPVVAPFNIVAYNVFSGSERGPSVFGTEPADFYLRNLLVNFHVWFVLASLAAPILGLQFVARQTASRFTLVRSLFCTAPFYLWLGLLSLQAHKEERFMYPIYPCIALNAALTLHALLGWLGNADRKTLIGKVPAALKLACVLGAVLLAVQAGLLRAVGVVTAYHAPLQVYAGLRGAAPTDTVCLGKEWHRFPSSYFLPNGVHAKFVRSEFDGLLPGEFSEAKTGFGFFPGTWLVPPGMNDRNVPDVGKYTDIRHCTYLVDSYFPGSEATALEPHYVADDATWERVQCAKFLDSSQTSLLGRLLWLPDLPRIPEEYRRKWGEYCLLRRREKV